MARNRSLLTLPVSNWNCSKPLLIENKNPTLDEWDLVLLYHFFIFEISIYGIGYQ